MSKILYLGAINEPVQMGYELVNIDHIMHVTMYENTPCSFALQMELVGGKTITIPYDTKEMLFTNFLHVKELMSK